MGDCFVEPALPQDAPTSIDVEVVGRAIRVVRRADGSFFAHDCIESDGGDPLPPPPELQYKVTKLFGSALYVHLPDEFNPAAAEDRARERIRAALAGEVLY